jgi:hypothetical protein
MTKLLGDVMSWISSNKTSVALFGATILTAAIIAGMQGCSLGELIRMRVPLDVQERLQLPASIAVDDAEIVIADHKAAFKRSHGQLVQNYDDAMWWKDLAAMGVNIGIAQGQGALSTIPGGALGVGLLGTLGALFVSKPGERKALKDQAKADIEAAVAATAATYMAKIASFNKGMKVGNGGDGDGA